jgi:hypothetical protein
MQDMTDVRDASALEPLIGTWELAAEFPTGEGAGVPGRTTFEWLLGRAFVLQRAEVDHPAAPDGHIILAPDPTRPDGWTQHYFDSRGVVRRYEMTFDGREWTLLRQTADDSPLDFRQRYVGRLSDDARTIDGQWEIDDGGGWRTDFRLTYRRAR